LDVEQPSQLRHPARPAGQDAHHPGLRGGQHALLGDPGEGPPARGGAPGPLAADEGADLRSQPLARLATVSADEQPDVAPVGFEWDGSFFYVGGRDPKRTRKYLNVQAGQTKVALVVDDLVSTNPWTPRFLRVY